MLDFSARERRLQALAKIHGRRKHWRDMRLPGLLEFARKVSPFPLYEWQEQFLGEPAKKELLIASRQSGKSYTAALLSLYDALSKPASLTLCVAPTLRQSMLLVSHAKGIYADAMLKGLTTLSIVNDSKTAIELSNYSRLISLPGSSGATIRGYSKPNRILVDEAGYVTNEVLYTVLRPMLAVNPEASYMMLGTPNGATGGFYEASRSKEFNVRKIPATEIPTISSSFLKRELAALGDELYDQEYFCQFLQRHDAVFNAEAIAKTVAHYEDQWALDDD